ncbi:MAG: DUF3568 family protein [Candidatus Omnitrophota bacterium]
MKNILFIFLISLSVSGCAALLVGGGVIGGVAISKDTVKSGVEANYNRVWGVSIDEVKKVADIRLEDKKRGIIEASSQSGEKITIKIREITRNSCEIIIKSRKNLLPDITLAHDLSNKIINRVK